MIHDVQDGYKFFEHSPHFSFGEILKDTAHFTVMQSTNLPDKNGKEIFEGDVVIENDFSGRHLHEVEYLASIAGFHSFTEPALGGQEWENAQPRDCEVIGNIYENWTCPRKVGARKRC